MPESKQLRGIQKNIKPFALDKNLLGIVQNKAERFMNPAEAKDILNMHALDDGSWSADNAGYTVLNDGGTAYESGAAVDGLFWYRDNDQNNHLLMAINGKLKEVNVGTGVGSDIDASAGYTVGALVDFQTLNNIVFTCDGNIATPRKWDGVTAAASGGWPVNDGTNQYNTPKYIEQHQGRLAYLNMQDAVGTADFSSHVILSNQGLGDTFTFPATTAAHAYVAQVGPLDGQRIVGAKSFMIPSTNQDVLVIFKDRSIYQLTGASGLLSDSDAFQIVRVNSDYGAFNNRCIVPFGSDLLALNEYGVISIRGQQSSGDLMVDIIGSDLVRDMVERINLSAKEQCWGIHLKDRREVWFGIPTGSSTQVNEYIVYKYPDPKNQRSYPKWSRRKEAGGKFKNRHGVNIDKAFYMGDYSGFVSSMFTASKYGGTGIPWIYKYPLYDFKNEQQIKRVIGAYAHFKIRSDLALNVRTEWVGGNNNNIKSQTMTLPTTLTGSVYGSATYGVSTYGSLQERKKPFKVPGNGQRLGIKLSGTTSATGPEFLGVTLITEFGASSQHFN